MKLVEGQYLKRIINVIDTPNIKVITGLRRCGKSCLLLQFMEYLKNEEENANIIYIDFNSIARVNSLMVCIPLNL